MQRWLATYNKRMAKEGASAERWLAELPAQMQIDAAVVERTRSSLTEFGGCAHIKSLAERDGVDVCVLTLARGQTIIDGVYVYEADNALGCFELLSFVSDVLPRLQQQRAGASMGRRLVFIVRHLPGGLRFILCSPTLFL